MNRKMAGVALVEVILVLVIASGIILLSIRLFAPIKRDGDIAQIKFNVDSIFSAAAEYYQANCRMQRDSLGAPTGTFGTLDPKNSPASPFPVTVTALNTSGFLNVILPMNGLINNTTANGGYIVQFNQAAPTDQLVAGNKMGKIYIWTIQVAVPIRSTTPLAIVQMLGADCAKNAAGGFVSSCSVASAVSTAQTVYAVWERLPSFAAPNVEAETWMGNDQVKAFTQLYTNNNIQNGQPGPPNTITNYQNYLCGG
jgi:hypothetical protein